MAEPEKSCEGIHPLLLDFVLGELEKSGAEHARVIEHLASCEDCQLRAGELKRTTHMLQAVGHRDEPDPVFENHVAHLAHAAAAQVRGSSRRDLASVSRATPRPRTPWWILLAAAALGVGLAWAIPASGILSHPPRAAVEPHAGIVEIRLAGEAWHRCPARAELPAGATVRVRGAGLARLDLAGHTVLLGPEAELTLPARRGGALRLETGSAFFEEPGSVIEAAGCRLEGPGARFAVSLDAAGRLTVAPATGSVRVKGRMGSVKLVAREATHLDASGRLASPRAASAADLAPWRFALAGDEALRDALGPDAGFLEDGRVRIECGFKNAPEPGTRWEDLFPVDGKSPWRVEGNWMKAVHAGVLALDLPLVTPASVELTLRPGRAAAGVGFMASPGACWLYRPGAKETRGKASHRLDQGPLKGLLTVLAPGKPFKRTDSLRARVALGENHIEVFAATRAVNRANIKAPRGPVRVVLFSRGRCAFSEIVVTGYLDPDWAAKHLGEKIGSGVSRLRPGSALPRTRPEGPAAPAPVRPEELPTGTEGDGRENVF